MGGCQCNCSCPDQNQFSGQQSGNSSSNWSSVNLAKKPSFNGKLDSNSYDDSEFRLVE